MPAAVGVIETCGFPAVLAAADAMVKGGHVTLSYFDKAEKGRFFVAVRGAISEVKPAVEAGLEAAENTFGGEVTSHYIIPNPPANIASVLPISYSEGSEAFRILPGE